MILASHVIFSTYGFWLPNDPRGSWSDFVGAWELVRFGPATKTDTRLSVAHHPHDRETRKQAKQVLKYPPVQFTGLQARAVGRGFDKSVRRGNVTVWACAILPEHVHLVLARHRHPVERLVNFLKGAATRELVAENLHPLAPWQKRGRPPRCWARGEWKVFLDSEKDVLRAINYVEDNPLKEGKPSQRWTFVTPYGYPV
jgi:REP element-mobilizing transposase RayT